LLLAYYYIATRQFDLALLQVEKIDLEKQSVLDKIDIVLLKSKVKLLTGHIDAALTYFEEASLLCSPNKPIDDIERSLYNAWSQCLIRKGDDQEAIKILKIWQQKDPDSIPVWNNLGFQYSVLGQNDKAIDAYEHAHKIDDKEPNVLMNLGVEYLRKNELQKALTFYEKAKISLEEGYEKYTEIVDGKIVTKQLLAMLEEAISILTEDNQEKIESFIASARGWQKKQQKEKLEEEYKIPYIPLKQRRKNLNKCRETIQNYIRKKFGANPNKFKNEFESTYKQATKLQEEGKNSVIPRKKDTDFFSYLDYGDFPYIIQNKMNEWKIGRDALNLLYSLKNFRNIASHFDGEEEGDLDKTDAAIEFGMAKRIREMFEKKINE
jgi:tetratricopeptide (TPR) repeat protein